MEAALVEGHEKRKKHRTATLLARFYQNNVRKEDYSRVVEMGRVEYSEGRLDLAALPDREPPPKISSRAIGVMPTPRKAVPDQMQKAVATLTVSGEAIKPPTYDKFNDGLPDDISDWDL